MLKTVRHTAFGVDASSPGAGAGARPAPIRGRVLPGGAWPAPPGFWGQGARPRLRAPSRPWARPRLRCP